MSTNAELQAASTRAQIFAGTLGPLSNLVNNVGFAIVAGAGGWMAVQGMATVGTIISFVNYARRFSWPLNQIAQPLQLRSSRPSPGAERVFEVMDEVPELADAPDAVPLDDDPGRRGL